MEPTLNFQEDIIDGNTIWFDRNLNFQLSNDLFDPTWINENATIKGAGLGRGQAIIFNHQNNALVYRHYHRGGLFGRINKDTYLRGAPTQSRAFKELTLLAEMTSMKLPVPRPIAARFAPSGIVYRADILVAEIPNTITFLDALRRSEIEQQDWAQLGRVVAAFHAKGIDHTDLNIRNILFDKDRRFWLIDFDKCSQRNHGNWTNGNLARLKRSIDKEHAKYHFNTWQAADWQTLMNSYQSAA